LTSIFPEGWQVDSFANCVYWVQLTRNKKGRLNEPSLFIVACRLTRELDAEGLGIEKDEHHNQRVDGQ
jgi:hypothetical protein